jgi:hypothetical protein
VSDSKKERTLAFVGIGVGSAALVAGAFLYLSAPHAAPADERRAGRLELTPEFDGRGSYGARLVGGF